MARAKVHAGRQPSPAANFGTPGAGLLFDRCLWKPGGLNTPPGSLAVILCLSKLGTHTLAVNADGALVVLSISVKKGQVLHLVNVAMGDKAECVVAYLGQRQNDLVEVGIAFRLPNPNFWRVAFPPRDWSRVEES